jgi:insertion element IS1 protein InsB
MECCVDCKSKAVKNGRTSYGKQKYLCKSCKRQFVKDGQDWFVSDADRAKIDKLLLERIPLRGITRVMDVSLSWLCNYVKTLYSTLPNDLHVIEEMPDEEKYLDDKFDKEINSRLIKKKRTA